MTIALRLHEDFAHEVVRLGAECQPVLVIDNFLAAPEALVELATQAPFSPVHDYVYPGLRVRMPMQYPYAIRGFLRELICDTFGFGVADVVGGQSDFSLATTPGENAHVRQKLPHFDGPEMNAIAGLHYLCGPGFGGTSFYRHRKTGFEYVSKERVEPYLRTLEAELAGAPLPAGYISGDTDLYERTASFEAKFNRLLLYRGVNLHCGDISGASSRDADPRTGRLTANTFLMFR